MSETEHVDVDIESMMQEAFADPSVSQFFVRQQQDGIDQVHFVHRCKFELQQQRQILHLIFHPPFKVVPELEAEILSDVDGRIRIAERFKFGARLEIILPQPCQEEKSILISSFATAQT